MTFRYQEMVAAGRTPSDRVMHCQDVYAWHPGISEGGGNWNYSVSNVVRASYYTTVAGDEQKLAAIRSEIANIDYWTKGNDGGISAKLVPVVYKKDSKSRKTRRVDIQIAIDMMRYAFTDQFDRIYLASGDGDYLPLIHEVMRRGKQLGLFAFSSGLNSELKPSVDYFFCLDDLFFADGK